MPHNSQLTTHNSSRAAAIPPNSREAAVPNFQTSKLPMKHRDLILLALPVSILALVALAVGLLVAQWRAFERSYICLLYTSDAADE